MKVKQVIEILQQLNPEHFAMVANRDGLLDDVILVDQSGPEIVEIKTRPPSSNKP